MKVIAETCRAY